MRGIASLGGEPASRPACHFARAIVGRLVVFSRKTSRQESPLAAKTGDPTHCAPKCEVILESAVRCLATGLQAKGYATDARANAGWSAEPLALLHSRQIARPCSDCDRIAENGCWRCP